MKMIKAMKKLKFWSRKKRKKYSIDPYFDYHYQLPSTYHHHHSYSCSSSSSSVQPSAPPLPPWLEPELTYNDDEPPSWVQSVVPEEELVYTSQTTHTMFTCQENDVQETSPMLPVESTPSSYYQRYNMDPNPVYGLPILQTNISSTNIESKSSGGAFVCFVKFGLNLVGCFCPCLSIREAHHDRLKLHPA
ncbi:hypothetical protein Ddye_000158 [Dipteronia dyeriana]|uniref:Uncharacterized protein n=1 Tax=Dipteronia dyeriana TaxID=168575 RepID=A0AAE0CSC7_9ROSI|nr:hypothetical protein Ddye_000158 [Dipteronia dyeriana]